MRAFAVLLVLATLAGPLVAPGAPRPAAITSEAAGVTVKVQPRDLGAATWEFDVTLESHTVALEDDLLGIARLVADGGAPVAASGWQGAAPGGHHRQGVLRFERVVPAPAELELRIHRPGEPAPRRFLWRLGDRQAR